MSEFVQLNASDGHTLGAYVSLPNGSPKAGIVILQEIFGVNSHIQAVADQYAAEGYATIAPSLFDRVEPKLDIPYSDIPKGLEYLQKLQPEQTVLDVKAAIEWAKQYGSTGIVGYCWGGTLAHLASANGLVDAAVSYYGGHIINMIDKVPSAPIIYHFGDSDTHIPADVIDKIRSAFPDREVYTYVGAGHGFNCDMRDDFNPEAANLAKKRTLEFLNQSLS